MTMKAWALGMIASASFAANGDIVCLWQHGGYHSYNGKAVINLEKRTATFDSSNGSESAFRADVVRQEDLNNYFFYEKQNGRLRTYGTTPSFDRYLTFDRQAMKAVFTIRYFNGSKISQQTQRVSDSCAYVK